MKWFALHRKLTLILAILLLLVILLIVSYSLKDKNNAVGNAAGSIVTFVQKPFSAVAGAIGNGLGGIFSNDDLAKENEQLKAKVEDLSEQLALSRISKEELAELKKLSASMGGITDIGDKKLKAANILSYEGSSNVRVFTIDMGTESGVKRNSVVLNGDGLVGRVLTSEKGWSRVVSIVDANNNIGFEIKGKDKNFLGVIHGDGSGMLTGYLLDEEGVANKGDEIFTSGIGGVYPGGIKIGTVTDAKLKGDSPLLNVEVEPYVYFKGMKKVAVLV